MPGTPGHFGSQLPQIPEDLLLAWIEGELLPTHVAELSEKHPEAVLLVSRLRRDRAAHASLPIERAPADLADRVVFALEREALLGIANGELLDESLPISKVPMKRTTSRQFWQRATPRLAMAAGLALVVSAGAILILRDGKSTRSNNDLAINDVAPTGTGTRGTADARTFDTFPTAADSTTIAAIAPVHEGLVADAAAKVEADANGYASSAVGVSPEAALTLAKEGRLIIRVRGGSSSAMARLDSVRARPGQGWRIVDRLTQESALALAPPPAPSAAPVAERDPFTLAASDAAAARTMPFIEAHPRPVLPFVVAPAAPIGFATEVIADAESIEALRAAFAKAAAGEAEFVQADYVVDYRRASRPERILWWTQPPETWAPRLIIPVIARRD